MCQTYPGAGPRLRDSGQLAIAEHLRTIVSPSWRVSLEELAGEHGEAIDMVLSGRDEIIAIEIERLATDWQALNRRATIKRAWLSEHAHVPVRLVVLLEDTRRNRSAMSVHLPLIATVMPLGTRAVLTAVRSGAPLGSDGLCWLRRRVPTPR